MIVQQPIQQRQTARVFYSQVLKPSYDSFHTAARQTPLVIMLWGPGRRMPKWSDMRLQIRNRLEQLGYTVFFSEQLGIPATASKQKAVEYLQRDAVDLIVVVQPSYGLVGSVSHFVEFRVIDSKMLLFIDETARDVHLYNRALTELRALYNNVETYTAPEDFTRDTLLGKIIAKVSLMQTVKYRAIQRARGWGLRLENPASDPGQPTGRRQPFQYNLLELYREHRDEMDVLNDPMRLFFLAYMNYTGRTLLKGLSKDVGLAEASLLDEMAPLLRGEMIARSNGSVAVTAYGRRMLDGLGLNVPATRISVPRIAPVMPAIMQRRMTAIATGAGLTLAAVMLFVLSLVNGMNVVSNRQPLELTRPAITATATHVPAPSSVPTSVPNR